MKANYLFWGIVSILILMMVSLPSQAFARDPGIPDTVRLGECPYYLTGPPYEGTLVIPLLVSHDEYLLGLYILLKWSGPMVCDSAKFVGEWLQYLTSCGIAIHPTIQTVFPWGFTGGVPMPPGERILAYLYFSITDTGFVSLDSTVLPAGEAYLHLVEEWVQVVNPQMVEWECHVVAGVPGDVTGDGQVELGDVVFLINYLYRQGSPPETGELGDVNGDGIIDLGDVVYLINYLFRDGPEPEKSCPAN